MVQVEELFIAPDKSIIDVLHIIDRGSVQIALVVDAEGRLLGTVTDGDIRRGILQGIKLDAPVSDIMNKQPKTATPDMDRDTMVSIMQYLNLRQFPVVDRDGKVVKLQLLDKLLQSQQRDNWVVLMAGGLGSRLGELTKDIPKPLLRVGSKPILEVIMEKFITNGFHKFYISVNYKAEMIKDFFGDGSRWGVKIRYLHEQQRLGTAGALSLIEEEHTEPLIVMNGDLLTKVNFGNLVDFHMDTNAKATMCVREYEFQVPYGVVQVAGHQLMGIAEKPMQRFFINGGIYVIDPSALNYIPQDKYYDMPTLFERLLADNEPTSVFPIREYWIDIGRTDDFEKANGEFRENFG